MMRHILIALCLICFGMSLADANVLYRDTSSTPSPKKKAAIRLLADDNQDCATAKPICTNNFQYDNNGGPGNVNDLDKINAPCLAVGGGAPVENNTAWYYFKATTSGSVWFKIHPGSPNADFDFIIWGPNVTCPVNGKKSLVCNGCADFGDTGLDSVGGHLDNVPGGPGRPGFDDRLSNPLQVQAGETYILMIDNYFGTDLGFEITFGGTASLDCDLIKPELGFTIDQVCVGGAVTLNTKSTQSHRWYTNQDTLNAFDTLKVVDVNPTVTTTYIVKGISDGGKAYRLTKVINVTPTPTIAVTSTAGDTICPGTNTTLKASGTGTTYQWARDPFPNTVISTGPDFSTSPAINSVYYVTATTNGCTGTFTKRINMRATVSYSVTYPNNVCPGQTATFVATPPQNTYQWTDVANPGTILGTLPTFAASPTISSTFRVTVSAPSLCSFTSTYPLNLRIPPSVTASITSTMEFCIGDQVPFRAGGASSYEWFSLPGNTSLGTGVNKTVNPTTTTSYYVVGKDGFACADTANITAVINQLPPVKIISTADTLCQGSQVILQAAGAASYVWTFKDAPTVVVSTSNNCLYVVDASRQLQLFGTDIHGCEAKDSVRIVPRPLPVVTNSIQKTQICPGDTNRITLLQSYPTIEWYVLSNPLGPLFSRDPMIEVTPTVTTSYLVKISDVHGCTATKSMGLLVNPKPTGSRIVGPSYVCPGAKNIRYVVPDGNKNNAFSWYVDGVKNNNYFNDTIYVDWTSGSNVGELLVIEKNAFCNGDSLLYPVSIRTNYVPPAPQGLSPLCSRDAQNVNYQVPVPSSGATYRWFVSGGTILGVDTFPSIQVDWLTSSTSYQLRYQEISRTADSLCYFNSKPLDVVVNPNPTASLVSGYPSVCKGNKQVAYALYGFPGSLYNWSLTPASTNTIAGVNTERFLSVNWDSTGIYTLKVIEKSEQGCYGDTARLEVTVNPLPVTDLVLGPFVVCPSMGERSSYMVPVTFENYGSRFVWTVKNGKIKSGQNSRNLEVAWNKKGPASIAVYQISKDSCVGPPVGIEVFLESTDAELQQVGTQYKYDTLVDVLWPLSRRGNQLASYKVERRKLDPANFAVIENWKQLTETGDTLYTDKDIKTDDEIAEYRYSLLDECDSVVKSEIQNTIVLNVLANEEQGTVYLKWNTYRNWRNGLFNYQVYRKLDTEKDFSYYADAGTDTTILLHNAFDGFKHSYRIKASELNSSAHSWSNKDDVTFEHAVFIPNTITPNGDGKNDSWVIRSVSAYKQAQVEIFNRWGQLIYEAKNYNNTWNGTSEAGKDLPDGVYYYVIKLVSEAGRKEYSGTLTILR